MLVLKRKLSQTIHIGDDIVIVVNKLDGHSVTLGIAAPKHLIIKRGEHVEDFDCDDGK